MADQPEQMTHDELVADMTRLREQNAQTGERLNFHNALPPQAAVLALRINTLLDSAFGFIDYSALADTERTSVERLAFEHAFQRRLQRLYLETQRELEERTGGLVTPPDQTRSHSSRERVNGANIATNDHHHRPRLGVLPA